MVIETAAANVSILVRIFRISMAQTFLDGFFDEQGSIAFFHEETDTLQFFSHGNSFNMMLKT